jgi:Holliday junction resolvase RusA-like endonuclease
MLESEITNLLKYGEATISVTTSPVSLQAKSNKKENLKNTIHNHFLNFDEIIISDIKVEIIWYCRTQERYETDKIADIDNIVKPILDSLCGEGGIIIDDNQVQTITAYWLDIWCGEEYFDINIKCFDTSFIKRSDLAYFEIRPNLYLPYNYRLEKNLIEKNISLLTFQFDTFDKLMKTGKGYDVARGILPCMRLFHKSRIPKCYQTFTKEELLSSNNV